MILVDFNQLVISNIFGGNCVEHGCVDDDKLSKMVNSQLSGLLTTYSTFGGVILCCDSESENYWRRQVFPYYKSNRADTIGQITYLEMRRTLRELLKRTPGMMWVLEVDACEADDLIAVYCMATYQFQSHIIISADKDFKQLHPTPEVRSIGIGVRQYSTIQKKMIECDDPQRFLFEQTIRGDRGDGIPNILSPSNSIVDGIRQTPITQKYLDSCYDLLMVKNVPLTKVFSHSEIAAFSRNSDLINFQAIPTQIRMKIIKTFIKRGIL